METRRKKMPRPHGKIHKLFNKFVVSWCTSVHVIVFICSVISNILSKLIIGVVVSNFDASDSERKEFNEQQFKALRKMHTLETKARICAEVVLYRACQSELPKWITYCVD